MSFRVLALRGATAFAFHTVFLGGCADGAAQTAVLDGGRSIPTYEVDSSWPSIPNNWVFGETSGLAVDADNNIWILQRPRSVSQGLRDRAAPPVLVFDVSGNFIKAWGGAGEGYEWPNSEHGIFVDHNGFVWIAGNGRSDHHILKFTSDGEFVMQIGRAGQSRGNKDTGNVNLPADVFLYPPTNELFVADGYGNRRVIVFDADTGEFKRMWGAFGNPPIDPEPEEQIDETNPQHFNRVHGVRVSNDGLVYVSDRLGMRLQVFTLNGEYIRQLFMGRTDPDPEELERRANETTTWGTPVTDLIRELGSARQSVSRTAFSPDPEQRFLFVAERSNQQVVILDRESLEPLGAFGRTGTAPGEFYVLHDMVVDSQGNLYTAEVNGGARAQKFTFVGMSAPP